MLGLRQGVGLFDLALAVGFTFGGEGSRPLRLTARYRVATIDFLQAGGDGLLPTNYVKQTRLVAEDLPYIPLYRRTLTWAHTRSIGLVQWPNDTLELRWVRIK